MIQMRENRYDDIRRGVVNRSGEVEKQSPSQPKKRRTIEASGHPSNETDPRANKADEYLDDEYNSWS
jgi:hypothetical protein